MYSESLVLKWCSARVHYKSVLQICGGRVPWYGCFNPQTFDRLNGLKYAFFCLCHHLKVYCQITYHTVFAIFHW